MTESTHSFRTKDGVHIAYLDIGKGSQTIVFVHGLTGSIPTWEPNYSFFKLYYRCIVVDLPGHGQSETGNYSYTPTFYAKVLSELLTYLQVNTPILVGHSMGGHVVLELLVHQSYIAKQIVLSAPAGLEQFTPEECKMLSSLTGSQVSVSMQGRLSGGSSGYFFESRNPIFLTVRKTLEDMTQRMQQHPVQVITRSIKGMLENPVIQQASVIAVPVLVVFGLDDKLIPNKLVHKIDVKTLAKESANYLKTATFEFYKHCGHMPHLEHASTFNLHMYKSINSHLYGS
jgi:pimeloyl-ACP methyl ester carboxylesterase